MQVLKCSFECKNSHKIVTGQQNGRTQQGAMVLVNKCITLISVAKPKVKYPKYYKHYDYNLEHNWVSCV